MSINSLLTNIPILNSLTKYIQSFLAVKNSIPFTIDLPQPNPYGLVAVFSNTSSYNSVGAVDITLTLQMTAFTNETQFQQIGIFGGDKAPDQIVTGLCYLTNDDNVQSFAVANLDTNNILSLINVTQYPQSPTPITAVIHLVYLA